MEWIFKNMKNGNRLEIIESIIINRNMLIPIEYCTKEEHKLGQFSK